MNTKTKIKAWIIGGLLVGIFGINVWSAFYHWSKHSEHQVLIKDK